MCPTDPIVTDRRRPTAELSLLQQIAFLSVSCWCLPAVAAQQLKKQGCECKVRERMRQVGKECALCRA